MIIVVNHKVSLAKQKLPDSLVRVIRRGRNSELGEDFRGRRKLEGPPDVDDLIWAIVGSRGFGVSSAIDIHLEVMRRRRPWIYQ